MAVLDASQAHDHLVNLGLRGARERIAHLLLELYVRLRGRFPVAAGETVRLPLTQNHIAQAVGLTGVQVSRTLRILREPGIARFVNRDLEILDPAASMWAAAWITEPANARVNVAKRPHSLGVPGASPFPQLPCPLWLGSPVWRHCVLIKSIGSAHR